MNISQLMLEEYPGPWSVNVKPTRSGGARVELLDFNGNPIATVHGESVEKAHAIAKQLCIVPEVIFEKNNPLP